MENFIERRTGFGNVVRYFAILFIALPFGWMFVSWFLFGFPTEQTFNWLGTILGAMTIFMGLGYFLIEKEIFKEEKGQALTEYLLTYGWALVVIVIVIAALFTFGIFDTPPNQQEELNEKKQPLTFDDYTTQNFDGNVLIIHCFKTSDNPNLVCIREIFKEGEIFVLPIKGV